MLYIGHLDTVPLVKQRLALGALVEERLRAPRVLAQQQGLTLSWEGPPTPVYVSGHREHIGRVVDNLVSNALKFTPAGGQVGVRLQARAGCVRLEVQDTGIGIPEALQDGLFDKFGKAARPSLHGLPSTGLGLYITRQIVQQHGGQIGVESREGEGATFWVELPSLA